MSSTKIEPQLSPEERRKKLIAAAMMQIEIDREMELFKMLEGSTAEWSHLCGDFERQLQENDDDSELDNDWKIKTHHQEEYNEYLGNQQEQLTLRVDETKRKLRKPEVESDDTDYAKLVMDLNRKVTNLKSELQSCQFRLDQESKAYHKADEKRSTLLKTAKHGHHLNDLIDNLEVRDKENEEKVRRGVDKIYKAKRNRLNRELTCPIRTRRKSARDEEITAITTTTPRVAVKPFVKRRPVIPAITQRKETERGARSPSPSKIPLPVTPAKTGRKIDLRRLAIMTSNAKNFQTIKEEEK